jgi:PAS domain S-box-containing protein
MQGRVLLHLEEERLKALHNLNILDGPPEKEFQDIVQLASKICEKPVAMISLLDKDRQWFKAKVGMDVDETPRELALGQYAIQNNDFFEVPDAQKHPLFKNHPFVINEPHVRYYAGAPLRFDDKLCIGTLCVMDRQPGQLSLEQKEYLTALANNAMKMFLLKHKMRELSKSRDLLHALQAINEDFIRDRANKIQLLQQMLEQALRVSESSKGIIAEISESNNSLIEVACINPLKGEPKKEKAPLCFPEAVLQESLRTCETSIINNFIGRESYLCIPILESSKKPIGVIGLGKSNSEYAENDRQLLQPFLTSCITLLLTTKAEELKKKTEDENQKITRQLLNAQAIAKTGSWEFHVDTGEMFWSEEQYRIFELPLMEADKLAQAANMRFEPEEREKNFKIYIEMAQMGKPFFYQQKIRFEDGRTKTILINGNPVLNEEGQLQMIQGTCQDVTEQRQRALDLQQFFDLSLDMLCITNREGIILKHSASFNEILGYADSDHKGLNLFELTHPDDLIRAKSEVQNLFQTGKLSNIQLRFLHKNGSYVLLEWTAAYDADSQRIFASAKDITGKAELEELLIQSKIEAEKARAKDIFLANMSHEIRTPLNAIIGFNEILANSRLDPDQRKNIEIVRSASKNLSVIINDILDVSKLESGKLELDFSPLRIENTCKQVIQLQMSEAKSKGVKLFFSYDNEIPELVKGDEVRLGQILINLISNSIKFTEKGQVELKVREESRDGSFSKINFTVADTGIGIPEDKIKKVFERFSQAETYTTRLYGGTGLGLSIVKSLIELHDGKISVKSQPGEGTEFSFSIRYEISDDQEEEGRLTEINLSEITDRLEGTRILLVEDNEHNQLLATSYLTKYKAKLDLASNGKQALEKLKEKKYDVILMDLQMPIMDGISATEEIRKTLKLQTPVIACSAHALSSERKKCMESGMNHYISKPYSEKILVQAILNLIPARKIGDTQNELQKISGDAIARTENNNHHGVAESNGRSGKPADWLSKAVISKIPDDVKILAEALENQDWHAIEFKAHNLISSLSILNQSEGIQLSRKLEAASHDKNEDKSIVLTRELIDYLNNLKEHQK